MRHIVLYFADNGWYSFKLPTLLVLNHIHDVLFYDFREKQILSCLLILISLEGKQAPFSYTFLKTALFKI